jgi:hypothetical protein
MGKLDKYPNTHCGEYSVSNKIGIIIIFIYLSLNCYI